MARIPSLLAVIVHIILQTLCPPLKCQWFLADIIRRVGTFSQDFLFYCLGSACSTTPAIRSKTLTSLISSTKPLRGLKEFRVSVANLPECLLQIRLESGLKFEWDPVDSHLANFFKQEEPTSGSRALIISVIHRLQMHSWLPTEKGLRVRYMPLFLPLLTKKTRAYFCHILPMRFLVWMLIFSSSCGRPWRGWTTGPSAMHFSHASMRSATNRLLLPNPKLSMDVSLFPLTSGGSVFGILSKPSFLLIFLPGWMTTTRLLNLKFASAPFMKSSSGFTSMSFRALFSVPR
jgi:hypothetical protein